MIGYKLENLLQNKNLMFYSIWSFLTIAVELFVFFFLQNTCRTDPVLQNTFQWLLLMHLNGIKLLVMVWEFCFPNSWSSALAFFPHQHVSPLVTFHLKFQLRRLLRRVHIYTCQFLFGQAKSWRWIPLHCCCVMHEHILCLPDWGTFSDYRKSGSFNC